MLCVCFFLCRCFLSVCAGRFVVVDTVDVLVVAVFGLFENLIMILSLDSYIPVFFLYFF